MSLSKHLKQFHGFKLVKGFAGMEEERDFGKFVCAGGILTQHLSVSTNMRVYGRLTSEQTNRPKVYGDRRHSGGHVQLCTRQGKRVPRMIARRGLESRS